MVEEIKFDRELDLKKEVCPYTFIKSKLAIEEMEKEKILKVIVSNSLSAEDVPRGIELEGHQILKIEKISDSQWHIWVKKQ